MTRFLAALAISVAAAARSGPGGWPPRHQQRRAPRHPRGPRRRLPRRRGRRRQDLRRHRRHRPRHARLHRHARQHRHRSATARSSTAAPPTSASSAGRWCRSSSTCRAVSAMPTSPAPRHARPGRRRRRAHDSAPDLRPEAVVRASVGLPRYSDVGGDESAFGYSAGLDIAFVFGLGLRTAYDWVDGDPETRRPGRSAPSGRSASDAARLGAATRGVLPGRLRPELRRDARRCPGHAGLARARRCPPAGSAFSVTGKAVYRCGGSLRSAARRCTRRSPVSSSAGRRVDVKIKVRSRWSDVLVTVLTAGIVVPRTVTAEGIVVR